MIAAVVSVFGLSILPVSGAGSITVTVSVSADPAGNQLTYRWRSSDGRIIDQDARSTQWTLPAGPGLHFAYVLISNGKGGYTERRIRVNTDGLSAVQLRPPMNLIAPPADGSSAVPFRAWLGGGLTLSPEELVVRLDPKEPTKLKVALPDVDVNAITPNISEQSITSLMGHFVLNKFAPPQSVPKLNCLVGTVEISSCLGRDASQTSDDQVFNVEANQTNRIDPVLTKSTGQGITQGITWYTGSVRLPDGSPCGTENEFFGVKKSATAELMGIPGTQVRANSWGQYSIPVTEQMRKMDLSVMVGCEDADPVTFPAKPGKPLPTPPGGDTGSLDFGVVTIGSNAPVVSSMSVTPARIPSTFDDPTKAPSLPSDIVPLRPAKFLAMKGLDTRLSGCLYYKAIGAVKKCDPEGNFLREDAVSFEDWKRAVKIDQYAPPGTQQYRAVFVNRVDLNLTRDHHSVSYNSMSNPMGATAGYVCNHLGPQPTAADPTGLDPTQDEIDKVIDDAVAGKNLVACVAMDYSVSPSVNKNLPFTRFLIFGPSGDLLPSVNLDGRGEKFPPGTCTVCHGGNKYAGKFPEDVGTGTADLEAHFLPFDIGNFEFRRTGWPALTKEAQQEAIYQLNQNVLKTKANPAEVDLINGWYKTTGHTQKDDFFPEGTVHPDFYLKVIARSCRTCHIAQRDEGSIRDLTFSKPTKGGLSSASILKELVCGQTDDLLRAYAMPNSKVTFDLFWMSRGSAANDQPQLVAGMSEVNECTNPKP